MLSRGLLGATNVRVGEHHKCRFLFTVRRKRDGQREGRKAINRGRLSRLKLQVSSQDIDGHDGRYSGSSDEGNRKGKFAPDAPSRGSGSTSRGSRRTRRPRTTSTLAISQQSALHMPAANSVPHDDGDNV